MLVFLKIASFFFVLRQMVAAHINHSPIKHAIASFYLSCFSLMILLYPPQLRQYSAKHQERTYLIYMSVLFFSALQNTGYAETLKTVCAVLIP